MGTNPFFQHQDNPGEQDLMTDLVQEVIQIHGIDMFYIPRESGTDAELRDALFGEDFEASYNKKYAIEMYLQNADGMEGEGDLLAKFGIVIRDQATLVCSRRRFKEATNYTAPREGDLIWYPRTRSLFEITYVNFDNPFYQFGKVYTFTLNIELFLFSEEEFSTGIYEVDKIPAERSYTTFFDLNTGGVGEFVDNELVTVTGSSFGAKVSDFVEDDLLLKVIYPSDADAPTNGFIVGLSSGASWGISYGDAFLMSNEGFADNNLFETDGGLVIDENDDDDFILGGF